MKDLKILNAVTRQYKIDENDQLESITFDTNMSNIFVTDNNKLFRVSNDELNHVWNQFYLFLILVNLI